jgi:hypothetical protein
MRMRGGLVGRVGVVLAMLGLMVTLAGTAWAATAKEYVAEKGYQFSPAVMETLESLGDLSATEQQFVDRLAAMDPSAQSSLALRYALDGDISMEELRNVPEPAKIPEDPLDILQNLIVHVKKEVWWSLYQHNKGIIAKEVLKIRDEAEKTFDNPELARKLIDAFLRKVEVSGDVKP